MEPAPHHPRRGFFRARGPANGFFFYATGATGAVADGDRVRWSPQAYWYPGRFGVLGECVVSRQDVRRVAAPAAGATLTHRAWQAQASCSLTGEAASYKGIKPLKRFDPAKDAWGAAAHYSEFRADPASFAMDSGAATGLYANRTTAAQRARAWSGGLNWHLNGALKVQADYDYTWFTGGASGAGRKAALRELLTRVQVVFQRCLIPAWFQPGPGTSTIWTPAPAGVAK